MQISQLLIRNLTHYWRTNLAVVLGVATAVAVLAGALLVGDSVRASLRDLFVQRLGQTDLVITSADFFREQLASDIENDPRFAASGFANTCPLIALEGAVTHEPSKRVGTGIKVYGVDERFWKFNGQSGKQSPQSREVFVSESLAQEFGASVGHSIVLRVQKPSDIPVESLHSRKEDLGSTMRLTVREILAADALGEFSLQPQQTVVRAIFVPLKSLQKEIDQLDKVNLILLSETSHQVAGTSEQGAKERAINRMLKERTTLADFGITLRTVGEAESISLEQDSKMISDSLAQRASETAIGLSLRSLPVFSYLANSISVGDRSIPYSLVTGLNDEALAELRRGDGETGRRGESTNAPHASVSPSPLPPVSPSPRPPVSLSPAHAIILNEWAARELGAKPADFISLEYYIWHESGRLETKTAKFRLAAVVPIKGLAGDRNLVPEYPGISGSEHLADWDPPFPIDLKRIRKQDEDYWDQYRTTPKAFVPLATAQELWQTRFGKLTSLRLIPIAGQPVESIRATFGQKLREILDPLTMGFAVIPVRAEGLQASRGATDFGEYFLYFSFFLVISALLLTALFFKLGVEQRLREIGLLQALGFPASKIRTLFLTEGVMLAVIGSLIGLLGAIAYGQFVMVGLRTWWVDAVGTTMLNLHISPVSLVLGAAGGIVAALVCIIWTLRSVGRKSTRSLLTGTLSQDTETPQRNNSNGRLLSSFPIAILFGVVGVVFLIAAALKFIGQTAGFFGGGMFLLVAALSFQSGWLRKVRRAILGAGWWSVARLGFRNATYRPGRSVLCIALIASAAFIIVAVDSFRHRESTTISDKKSGNGGFPLLAESLLPLVHDPNTREGQEALNLTTNDVEAPLSGVTFQRFRVRPGDDASCLNLYQPRSPKIIAPTADFVSSNRFAFQNSLASTADEKQNPWLLLNRQFPDGAVPVIADANSMTYALHLKLGDDLVLNQGDHPIRLRFVGSLADSIFQSELLMAESNFVRLFPEQEGYRFFLIDTSTPDKATAVATDLEDRLSDFGFDVQPTAERLANFHRVENTYLSTFQMLGGLGLVLGTLGMAAVLLRNVLERRRELALLRAVGFNSAHFTVMVVAENALLLFCGLITGTICALLAIAPLFFSRHSQLPNVSLGLLLLAVLISGLTASIVATWTALRSPLLPALRSE
jgi:putative ABC transport system permease protein